MYVVGLAPTKLHESKNSSEVGPLAHQVEHHTFNVVVAGSSPARLTTHSTYNQTGR